MADNTSQIYLDGRQAVTKSFPPTDWVETTLGEVVEITSSKRIFANEYQTSGIPFFRGKEVTEKFNGNEISTELFITEEKYNEIKNNFGVPEENDILLTSVGTLGNPYLVEKGFKFYFKDGNLTWFRKYKNIVPKWLYYWIISPQGKEILSYAKIGSTQEAYTIVKLKNLEILLPPLSEQKAIASVLSSFDDKIELLREQNKTLEEMGQTIFKEWFGKYSVDNPNDLPEDWRIGKLGEVVKFIQGTQVPSEYQIEEHKENNDKFLRIVDYMSNFSEKPRYIPKKDTNTYCNEDEIIMVRYGEVGFVGRRMSGVFANNLFKILPKDPINNDFLYYFLKSNDIQQYIKNNSAGSALPAIKHSTVGDIELVIPSKEIIEDFRDFTKKTERKILDNNSQIQFLARSRYELLPKLMSGQVRVKL
jgi:type I restriction enzyme S subunit